MTDHPPAGRSGLGPAIAFLGSVIGASACFVGAAAELAALGREHNAPTGLKLGVAIAFSIGAIILIRTAVHAEHNLRATRDSVPAPAAAGRSPKNGPVARSVGIVLVIGFVAIQIALTVSLHSAAVRSSDTQHHGIERSAIVAAVHHQSHSTRYDSWFTYNYDVRLVQPATGVTTTVLHDPTRDLQRYEIGQSATVLVDPKDLDYAELPGQPVQSARWELGPIIFSAVFVLTGIAIFVEQRKHRRLHASDPAGVVTPTWS